MKTYVIADAGPLVALLNRHDPFHAWSLGIVDKLTGPLYTCEAVLTEAMFLLRGVYGARAAVLDMLLDGFLEVDFQVKEHQKQLHEMIRRYDNVPMSLADACLVRMAELQPRSEVFTLDSDFHIYRKNARYAIPTIEPSR
jgi:uncharacterized protein